ncbi:ADP-ribose glycohydrolase OARD1 isoform X1 [Lucilia cuprina]|uniref:ADP-ribose glycohydrolase OARD1 isoform X1 n=2 Tax=Lucilia cuprina TaxID=7375 RepID=UPI001F066E86|nr:ADP-ribose glycohydrolase OARD1 isoform X1 [Lucilia cuprina]
MLCFRNLIKLTNNSLKQNTNCWKLLLKNQELIAINLKSNKRNMSSYNYKLTEVEGDLFSAPKDYSLAHCVAADLGMGAGIAVVFKKVYGQLDVLRAQDVKTGGVAVLKDNERYIYYLVTKDQSWDKPTYDSLRASLCAMREHMRSNNVHKLAIPRIGCGIDGLEWDKVSSELNGVFNKEDLEIVVYNFVPK